MQPVSGNIAHTSLVVIEDGMVPVGDVVGTSQPNLPRRFPIADMELSSDQSVDAEEGPDLISFNDIIGATNCAVDQFEEEPVAGRILDHQFRKRKAPVFSDESSESEYSSSSESFISMGDNLYTFSRCATSSPISLHEVVIIHLSLDEDEDVDVDFSGSISY